MGEYERKRFEDGYFFRNGTLLQSFYLREMGDIFEHLEVDCVVLDDLTMDYSSLIHVFHWLGKRPTNKLIITTSILTILKPEIRVRERLNTFAMDGWTIGEYIAAMKDSEFQKLHPDLIDNEDFEAKFLFAGASARWMFGSWDTLKFAMKYYIDSVAETDLVKGYKRNSENSAVSHLLTVIKGTDQIVSQQVAIQLVWKYSIAFLGIARAHCGNDPTISEGLLKADILLQVFFLVRESYYLIIIILK